MIYPRNLLHISRIYNELCVFIKKFLINIFVIYYVLYPFLGKILMKCELNIEIFVLSDYRSTIFNRNRTKYEKSDIFHKKKWKI